MKKALIEKLEKDLKEFEDETYNEFKDFVESESNKDCEFYNDIHKYVMNIDWEDPSYSVWFNKWIEYVLWLLRKTKEVNKIDFNDFINLVNKNLWIEDESELEDYLDYLDYSDVLPKYINLLHDMWLSYTISELKDEWTIVYEYYKIKNNDNEIFVLQDYFSFNYNSYKELYDELYRLESLVLNF